MTARTRRRLAAASFGPEWAPHTGMLGRALTDDAPPRDRERNLAHLRAARRDLATVEAIYDKAAGREVTR